MRRVKSPGDRVEAFRFGPNNPPPKSPGRPKLEFTKAECERLAREHAPAALESIARLGLKAKSEMVRMLASDKILDRAVGKPAQVQEHTIALKPSGQEIEVFGQLLDRLEDTDSAVPALPSPGLNEPGGES